MNAERILELKINQKVKYLFISEYYKYHIEPLCNDLWKREGKDFLFVETGTYTNDLKITNNIASEDHYEYTISLYRNPEYEELIDMLVLNSDVVILGFGQKCYEYNKIRMTNNSNALTFKMKERLFRWGIDKLCDPSYHDRLDYKYTNWFNYSHYILCVGAYTAYDLHLIGARRDHLIHFGYWVPQSSNSWEELKKQKSANYDTIKVLWVGRLIKLKHPEIALKAIDNLKDERMDLTIIGYGEEEDNLRSIADELNINDRIHFIGIEDRFGVRESMKKADILLVTSDYREGWAMVIPEAMSEGCCVVSSKAAGAAPVLIQDGINGYMFDYRNQDELDRILRMLVHDRKLIYKAGERAYYYMRDNWNVNNAVSRLTNICEQYLEGREITLYDSGICSSSEIISCSESIDR